MLDSSCEFFFILHCTLYFGILQVYRTKICLCFVTIQVYQVNTSNYICHSKYYGRCLDDDGVHQALCQFLHNGRRLRRELVDGIIARLYRLNKMLLKQNTFRFYSSSLLIMYDGVEDDDTVDDSRDHGDHMDGESLPSTRRRTSDVRMIDFAHATHEGFLSDETVHVGPDQGYLYGLQNLIHMFEDIKTEDLASSSGGGGDQR